MPASPSPDLLSEALELARLGWSVFPIYPRSKKPFVASRGYLDATQGEAQIRAWWERVPDANIGIACGASGLVVLDVDPRNGGNESLAALEAKHGPLPATLEARTGGGGRHFYFIGNLRKGVLGPGLDLQGAGAYVVAPPSVTEGPYTWTTGGAPAPVPSWFGAPLDLPAGEQPGTDGDAAWSVLGAAFESVGWLGKRLREGNRAVRCPWAHEHSGGKDFDTSTIIMPPRGASRVGWFHCSHSHCHGRTATDALNALGPQARAAADARYPKPDRTSSGQENGIPRPETAPDGSPSIAQENTQSGHAASDKDPSDPGKKPSLAIVGETGAELAEAPPPIAWICRGLHLAPGRPTLLSAFGGAGKTWAAMDLALAVATGGATALAGLHLQRWGRVVHLNAEMHRAQVRRRYQRLAYARGVDLATARLEVASRSHFGSFSLCQPDAKQRLIATCEGATLLVIDSFRALTAGVEENSSEIRAYLDLLLEVTERTGVCVLVIHHEGKPPSDGQRDAVHRIRGSGAIVDACDTTWHFSTRDGVLRLEQGKVSLGEKREDRRLRLVDVGTREDGADASPGIGWELVTEETAGEDAAPPGWEAARTAILIAIREAGELNTRAIIAGRSEDGRPIVAGNKALKTDALEALLMEGALTVKAGPNRQKVYALATNTDSKEGPAS